jgi:hypothetical protein
VRLGLDCLPLFVIAPASPVGVPGDEGSPPGLPPCTDPAGLVTATVRCAKARLARDSAPPEPAAGAPAVPLPLALPAAVVDPAEALGTRRDDPCWETEWLPAPAAAPAPANGSSKAIHLILQPWLAAAPPADEDPAPAPPCEPGVPNPAPAVVVTNPAQWRPVWGGPGVGGALRSRDPAGIGGMARSMVLARLGVRDAKASAERAELGAMEAGLWCRDLCRCAGVSCCPALKPLMPAPGGAVLMGGSLGCRCTVAGTSADAARPVSTLNAMGVPCNLLSPTDLPVGVDVALVLAAFAALAPASGCGLGPASILNSTTSVPSLTARSPS